MKRYWAPLGRFDAYAAANLVTETFIAEVLGVRSFSVLVPHLEVAYVENAEFSRRILRRGICDFGDRGDCEAVLEPRSFFHVGVMGGCRSFIREWLIPAAVNGR